MTARPSSDLTTWATTGTIIEPSSGQIAAGWAPGDRPPAEWLNFVFSNLSLWASYLDTEHLPDVTQATASTPILGTNSTAADHAAGNNWKLFLHAKCVDGSYMRLYAGEGNDSTLSGDWCITANAAFNPSTQLWSQDQAGQESTILWVADGQLRWYGKAPGSGPWATSAWDTTRAALVVGDDVTAGGDLAVGGDAGVGDDLTVGGDAAVTGALTAATVGVTGTATVIDLGPGGLRVNGALDVNGDLYSSDDVIAEGEFQYGTPPSRLVAIDILHGVGGTLDNVGEDVILAPGAALVIPIRPPHGATLSVVFVKVFLFLGDSASIDLGIYSQAAPNYLATTVPSTTVVDTVSTTALTDNQATNFSMDFGGLTVSKDERYWLQVHNDAGSADVIQVYAAAYTFTDPGPRNH